MKKILILAFTILFLSSLASAYSLDITFPNEKTSFASGEAITFKVIIYDDSGNQIDGEVSIVVEDAERQVRIERIVTSKDLVSIDLGERATSGQGVIQAEYQEVKAIAFFEVGRKELALFEIEGNNLKVTNIGNTKYSRVITITIGETIGTKEPELEPGQSTSYRLVAPEGTYNVRVTDGITSLIRGDVPLSGTGQVIGAIDDSASRRSPFTGGVSPDDNSDIAWLSYVKNNTFIYVFVLVIFGAMILIAVERQYRKKPKK
jgi:hypothetical protein